MNEAVILRQDTTAPRISCPPGEDVRYFGSHIEALIQAPITVVELVMRSKSELSGIH